MHILADLSILFQGTSLMLKECAERRSLKAERLPSKTSARTEELQLKQHDELDAKVRGLADLSNQDGNLS